MTCFKTKENKYHLLCSVVPQCVCHVGMARKCTATFAQTLSTLVPWLLWKCSLICPFVAPLLLQHSSPQQEHINGKSNPIFIIICIWLTLQTWQFPDFSPDQWARAGLHPAARSASLGSSYLDKATAEPGGLHSTLVSVLRGTTHTPALQSTALSASCTQAAARQRSHPCTPCCPFVSIFAPWDCKDTMSVQISAPRLCSVLFRAVSGPPWHDEPRPPSCALDEGQWYRHMSRAALGSLSLAADSYQALCCRKKYWWKSKVVLFLQASCN